MLYEVITRTTWQYMTTAKATKASPSNRLAVSRNSNNRNNFVQHTLYEVIRVKKYIELINGIQEYQNIFNSDNFSEKLKIRKANTKIVKKICETWLETHEITDKQMETIDEKIKEI